MLSLRVLEHEIFHLFLEILSVVHLKMVVDLLDHGDGIGDELLVGDVKELLLLPLLIHLHPEFGGFVCDLGQKPVEALSQVSLVPLLGINLRTSVDHLTVRWNCSERISVGVDDADIRERFEEMREIKSVER